jgi:hypothetical protein
LDAALDEMETALLTRTRHTIDQTDPRSIPAPLVLITSPAPHAERRLQAVLDNGSALGLTSILLASGEPARPCEYGPTAR